jgi:2'-5' RNA ligase
MARYRYFLGLALPDGAGRRVDGLRQSFGWDRRIVDRDRLHMTVAVIDLSCDRRRPEYGQGVEQALAGVELPAVSVRFDRRDRGMLVYSDRLAGFHGLQQTVIAALLRHRIAVDHAPRRPHVSLCYDPSASGRDRIEPIEWRAGEMRLIESHLGQSLHHALSRWRLGGDAEPVPVQLSLL